MPRNKGIPPEDNVWSGRYDRQLALGNDSVNSYSGRKPGDELKQTLIYDNGKDPEKLDDPLGPYNETVAGRNPRQFTPVSPFSPFGTEDTDSNNIMRRPQKVANPTPKRGLPPAPADDFTPWKPKGRK